MTLPPDEHEDEPIYGDADGDADGDVSGEVDRYSDADDDLIDLTPDDEQLIDDDLEAVRSGDDPASTADFTAADTDVEGTHSPITKVRAETGMAEELGGRNRIIGVIVAIVAISALVGFFVARSAENTDLKLVEGSVQESLTLDCFWTIQYEVTNTSDQTLVMIDTSVFTGRGDLAVTQAARDIVVEPGQTVPNLIQYYVNGCPGEPAEIDHGQLEILNATLTGVQQTTRLQF